MMLMGEWLGLRKFLKTLPSKDEKLAKEDMNFVMQGCVNYMVCGWNGVPNKWHWTSILSCLFWEIGFLVALIVAYEDGWHIIHLSTLV